MSNTFNSSSRYPNRERGCQPYAKRQSYQNKRKKIRNRRIIPRCILGIPSTLTINIFKVTSIKLLILHMKILSKYLSRIFGNCILNLVYLVERESINCSYKPNLLTTPNTMNCAEIEINSLNIFKNSHQKINIILLRYNQISSTTTLIII